MNSESLKYIATDVVKSFTSVKTAKTLNLAQKLDFGDSIVMKGVSNGGVYSLMNDFVNYLTLGQAKILKLDYKGLLDDLAYFALVSTGSQAVGTDAMLMNTIMQVSPINDIVTNQDITEAEI